jgi:hypothetical protein
MKRHTTKWSRPRKRIKLRKARTMSINEKVALVTGAGQGIDVRLR